MKCNAPIDPQTKIAIANIEAEVNASQFPRCGYELYAEDKFCPACGAKVTCYNKSDNQDFGLSVAFFVIELAAIVGILIWSVYLSSTFWLIVLLCCLFAAVEFAADTIVDICKKAFGGEEVEMSSEKAGVLHWVSVFLLCIPLIAPAYGFIQGGIESLRCIDKGKINLATYFANKREMNLLTRIGYRWIYHMFWDFKGAEDSILDTSPLGVLSQMPVNAMTGTVDDGDDELSQAEDDMRLGLKSSTALMKDDYTEARQLARKISDKDLREFQLANIDQAESLKQSADDLKKSAKEFEDNMKAAAALQLLFGGR